jgi:hypothetical protein
MEQAPEQHDHSQAERCDQCPSCHAHSHAYPATTQTGAIAPPCHTLNAITGAHQRTPFPTLIDRPPIA